MCMHFEMDHEKATQALNYLATRSGGRINRITALKLIFFADRHHLRKYGRPIIGDEYFAMPMGPVPSMTENISEKTCLDDVEREYADRYLGLSEDKKTILSISPVDKNVFSESDIESLCFSWDTFSPFGMRVIDISHAYPEWEKFKVRLDNKSSKRCLMDYLDFFSDATPDNPELRLLRGRDVFKDTVSKEEIESAIDAARERITIQALWNK